MLYLVNVVSILFNLTILIMKLQIYIRHHKVKVANRVHKDTKIEKTKDELDDSMTL
ncbi:hypothetical protein FACS1894166_11510 [Bacilli bacterium]|nr:hypothetical protein FACS1894166_11510 [Bacilli bacterium]